MSGLPMQTPPGAFPGPMVVQQSNGVGSPLGSLGQLMVSAPTLAQHSRSEDSSFATQRLISKLVPGCRAVCKQCFGAERGGYWGAG